MTGVIEQTLSSISTNINVNRCIIIIIIIYSIIGGTSDQRNRCIYIAVHAYTCKAIALFYIIHRMKR